MLRPVKQNKMSFSSIETNKPLPAPINSVFVGQVQVQKLTIVVAINQLPDHT